MRNRLESHPQTLSLLLIAVGCALFTCGSLLAPAPASDQQPAAPSSAESGHPRCWPEIGKAAPNADLEDIDRDDGPEYEFQGHVAHLPKPAFCESIGTSLRVRIRCSLSQGPIADRSPPAT